MSIDELQVKKQEKGKRLKQLRALLDLNQEDFALGSGVSLSSLRQWENALLSGLSENGADLIIAFVKSKGIIASKTWLLEGIGNPPRIDPLYQAKSEIAHIREKLTAQEESVNKDAEWTLENEIDTFKKINPYAVILKIEDDSMLPRYQPEDYVGGRFLFGDDISQALNQDCIIKLEDDRMVFLHLVKGEKPGLYNAYSLNLQASSNSEPLFNISLKAVAPVIRVWRLK